MVAWRLFSCWVTRRQHGVRHVALRWPIATAAWSWSSIPTGTASTTRILPRLRSDIDWVSLRDGKPPVAFEVRASHRLRSGGDLACEIYPDVFVSTRNRGFCPDWPAWRCNSPATSSTHCPMTRRSGFAFTASNTPSAGSGPSRGFRTNTGESSTEADGPSIDHRSGRWGRRVRRAVG